jgi:hypothetical protein
MPGNLYFPPFRVEQNPLPYLEKKATSLRRAWAGLQGLRETAVSISTGTGAEILAPSESVDYIFTDPPFGWNLQYSELNFVYEGLLGIATNATGEAVVNESQHKDLLDYQAIMASCFAENHRILKPGRWMTVEFHNSSNLVWNAIQEAIQRAGFIIGDVRTLDKGLGTLNQFTAAGAVKQDLVISAYKPRAGFERTFSIEAGSEQGAWDFVRQHLEQLPVFVERAGRVEVIAERQNYLLYDRMIAFHIQRGATIPLSAGDFYRGLRERLVERDDMYFTVSQAADYDRRRMEAKEIEQLSVFVVDEKSAIQWVRAELAAQPQTFQDLTPKFLRELNKNRFEEMPELRVILEQNFLEDPDTHRWRVPDPAKQADLEALRTRELLNEFGAYLGGTARLKRFRLEAVRAGIADLWSKRDYKAIIKLCERLPDEVVQEDPALLMYYDNAVMRQGAG